MTEKLISCNACGSNLKFDPASSQLTCDRCGAKNEIIEQESELHLKELSFDDFDDAINSSDEVESQTIKCKSCAAEFSVDSDSGSGECVFCTTPYVSQDIFAQKQHAPSSVLPFSITKKVAQESFKEWINALWFAPSALKQLVTRLNGLQGIYYPYWTYDCSTTTEYRGQRGDAYYVTESYTTTDSDGNSVSKTRQVRRIRWSRASGVVYDEFDDILVPAHDSLSRPKLNELEPWALEDLKAYQPDYIVGFKALNYNVEMKEGFGKYALPVIRDTIDDSIRRDIGGDEQRILQKSENFKDQTFKHILLPVWVSSYKFSEKVYHITINASTGEVQGDRPYSWVKITAAVLGVILIIALIYAFMNRAQIMQSFQ